MTRFLASLALVCLTALATAAERIPADCTWVVHLDVQALLHSKAGEWIGQQMLKQPHAARLQMLEAVSGLQIKRDLREVTICGVGANDGTGLVLVRGTFAAAHLTTLAQAAEDHAVVLVGSRTIHTWTDKGKPAAGCLAAPDLLILGTTSTRLREALVALDAAASAGATFPLPPGWEGSALMVCAADQLSALVPGKRESAMLRNVHALVGRVIEDGAQIAVEARATTTSETAAQQLVDAGRGLAALLQLQRPEHVDPALIEAVRSAALVREGSTVCLRLALPIDEALRLIEQRRGR